jgi:hypothetical protein
VGFCIRKRWLLWSEIPELRKYLGQMDTYRFVKKTMDKRAFSMAHPLILSLRMDNPVNRC